METNETGQVISYEEYHPFGTSAYRTAKSNTDLSLKRYRFTNKERDDETGLYYFGVRYYAAWLGRWTSSDPGDFVDGLNMYQYAQNNPVKLVDADGYKAVEPENREGGGQKGGEAILDEKGEKILDSEGNPLLAGGDGVATATDDSSDPPPGFKTYKGVDGDLTLPENAIVGFNDAGTTVDFFWVTGEFYFTRNEEDKYATSGSGYYNRSNNKWENPSISFEVGGLNEPKGILDVTFKVSGLDASTLQVVQIVQMSEMYSTVVPIAERNGIKMTDGFMTGSYMFTEGDTKMSGHVDGGKDSYWAKSYKRGTKSPNGPVHPTKPYYNDNGSSGKIRIYDKPTIQNGVEILKLTTIIIAVDYNGSGKDLILGSFDWGWKGFDFTGSFPILKNAWVSPISLNNEKISDTNLQILNHHYSEYSFFNFKKLEYVYILPEITKERS
jgi:RHS repeat-associated protein